MPLGRVVVGLVFAVPLQAQDHRLIANDPPAIELPDEFSRIGQVFELKDGNVLILDRLEGKVRLANMMNRVTSPVGREGAGPREYRAAYSLLPLGGDSVGILDDANARILVVTADGVPGGFVSPYVNESRYGTMISARTSDGRGWFYTERSAERSSTGAMQFSDSAWIVRWKPGTNAVDVAARIYRPPIPGARRLPNGQSVHQPGAVPAMQAWPTWTAGPDGRVAVINVDPYRVDYVSATGTRRQGSAIAYTRIPLNDSIKAAYQSDMSQPQMTVVVDGATGKSTNMRSVPPLFRVTNWAAEVPPFRGDAFIAFAPNGELWIQRTTFRREGARYDIIGPDGSLVDRVRLPEGHRVVGFGRDAMYVVRRDADDLEFLQRRVMPR